MTLVLAVLAVTFLVGVLIGCSLTERVLEARTRRQAVVQRTLNSQWLELKAAQRALFRTYPIDPVELKCSDCGQAEGKLLQWTAVSGGQDLPVLEVGDAAFDGGANP
jgi:hypothetical protein